MARVDTDALASSGKALAIIFIILIVPINAGLIFKIVKRKLSKFRFMSDPKQMTIISLAIGDIFLALFSLVAHATVLFEGAESLTCRTKFLADMYAAFLLNFVYGTGLVVLAVELILRMLRSSTGGQSLKLLAVITSALPWTLGLLNVLPLTIAPWNWDTCQLEIPTYHDTIQAWYIVSICTPASLALLVSFITCCVPQRINPDPPYRDLPVTQARSQNPTTNNSPDSSTRNMPLQLSTASGYNPQASNPYPPQPYPKDATSPPQHTSPAQHQLSNNPENVYIPQTHNITLISTSFGKEKVTLFLVCLVYFTCAIPIAGYFLGSVLNEDRPDVDELADAVMDRLFYWLLIFRSVLTPLIWICRLDD